MSWVKALTSKSLRRLKTSASHSGTDMMSCVNPAVSAAAGMRATASPRYGLLGGRVGYQ